MHSKDKTLLARDRMFSFSRYLKIKTILDVGSGTGELLLHAKGYPEFSVKGVEPVKELRDVGYASAVLPQDLMQGNGLELPFADRSFDLVCAFSILNHVHNPTQVIPEMLRVSRGAIFISDSNNFGQGSMIKRGMKQILNSLGLWPLMNFIKTRGLGYAITEGDGLAYSYSVFTNYSQISKACAIVHVVNTSSGGINPYRSADSIALFGIKK